MKQQTLSIFYDGECPFCSRYVRYYRLNDGSMDISLTNIRNEPNKIAEFDAMGFNVDEGMIILVNNETYHGVEAVHILALLSTHSGLFNKCNRWIFSHHLLAALLYPVMVSGRNFFLFMLGIKKIKTT